MTGKENYLNCLLHRDRQWIPVEGEDLIYTGFEFNSMEKGPMGGGGGLHRRRLCSLVFRAAL